MYRIHSANKLSRRGLRKSEIIAKLDFADWSDGTEDLSSEPSSDNLDILVKDISPETEDFLTSNNQAEDFLQSDNELSSADSDSADDIIQQSPDAYLAVDLKNPVLPGCNPIKCQRKCQTQITSIRQKTINRDFWNKAYNDRRKWISVSCSRRKQELSSPKRRQNILYSLRNSAGDNVRVCQHFFLSTIGRKPRHDQMIRTALNSIEIGENLPKTDLRGKHCKKGRDTETIKRHIMGFNPQISHYRREHAPRKLYLPSEITITDMHKDYISKFGKISYSTYYKEITDLNISFTKLGEEQCEMQLSL